MKKKDKKRTSVLGAISQSSGLPLDMLTRLPMIKMLSNREIYIEDAGRIIWYDSSCVILLQRKTKIDITGEGLNLKSLANGNISVDGYIKNVCFDKEGDEK